MKDFPQKLETLSQKKVLVVGDVMLDVSVKGNVSRISPEAPVPVLHVSDEVASLGGAAHCARNISVLGGNVSILGVTGNDPHRFILLDLLKKQGIHVEGLFVDPSRPTTKKTRYFSGGQHLLRHDHEDTSPVASEVEDAIVQHLSQTIPSVDVVLVSDYAKGLLTEKVISQLLALSIQHNVPVLVDTKPGRLALFKGAYLVTLNQQEAMSFTKMKGSDASAFSEMALYMANVLKSNVVITRGGEGMTICTLGGEVAHISSRKQEVIDATGAGDTVTSMLGVMTVLDYNLKDAASIANYAGAVVVTKKGASTVSKEELQRFFRLDIYEYLRESMRVKEAVIATQLDKIEEIAHRIIEAYKHNKKILVFGNGGSAADAQHFAAELVGRYKMERKGLPALALTTDTSILTAVGNDYGYDQIFSRQIEALCNTEDVVIGISTSGNSPNVLLALEEAKKRGAFTIALTGRDGGKAAPMADIGIIVPSDASSWIQESHIAIIHILCELLENKLREGGFV